MFVVLSLLNSFLKFSFFRSILDGTEKEIQGSSILVKEAKQKLIAEAGRAVKIVIGGVTQEKLQKQNPATKRCETIKEWKKWKAKGEPTDLKASAALKGNRHFFLCFIISYTAFHEQLYHFLK
jgi:hypothetical protein